MELNFKANTYRCRVHSGKDALQALPADLRRLGVQRAMILCGRSVAHQTDLIDRMRALLGDSCAAVFDRAGRHSDVESVQASAAMAREAGADGIIAVGAGSVMMSGRLTAILLAERAPVDELVTRYDGDAPAVSPRLDAPKLPIINVLTAATSAQNRAGSAMRRPGEMRRLEVFDPKTRPASIYWDSDALLTAPVHLARTGGLTIFWFSLMALGGIEAANPLAQADGRQAFRLAFDALPRLEDPHDADARIAMCAASFLQNRNEDDGGGMLRSQWVQRVCYALGSGIFTQRDDIDPGPVYLALTGPAIEQFGERCLPQLRAMAEAIGTPAAEARQAALARLRHDILAFFERAGHAYRLRDLGVDRAALPAIRDFAMRNFNADRHRELRHETTRLDATLAAAW